MAKVELRGISRRFGGVVALERLDLEIASGEFISLLGPSGCGKTTALRIVAGFEWPDTGEVLLDGQDVLGLAPNKRNMGMVFQAYSLFPNMTAKGNVEFSMKIRHQPRQERSARALELLALVGLADQANRYPRQLSGGQQQRVALARALALEPAVLLLDEPLSALDAKVRVQLREEVRSLQRKLGITTLYVTHDQEEALSVSDRVAVMSAGKLEQLGTPAEVYGRPLTPFVAGFVGTTNRLEGAVLSRGDRTVRCGPAVFRLPESAFAQATGDVVMVYVRPEAIRLEPLSNGTNPREGTFEGEVTSHTFLGAVTRVSVSSDLGQLLVDVSSTTALELSIGQKVGIGIESEALQTITG